MTPQDFTARLTQSYLMWFVLPLWIAAGFADYWCHRRTHIERTSGWRESVIHWLLFGEMAFPSLAALFLDVDSLVIALMVGTLLLHELTAYWDLRLAAPLRRIGPVEQMVHSFLEMLPLMSASMVTLLHPRAALALLGVGHADFGLRWKEPPLPGVYRAGVLAALGLFIVLPYAEETWRCLRCRRARHSAQPA